MIKTEDLVTEVKKIGFANNLCNQSLLANLVTMIRQAPIMPFDALLRSAESVICTCAARSVRFIFI